MRVLVTLSVLAIIFGSLYPFDFDLSLLGTRTMGASDASPSFSDILANIALFIPFGLACGLDRYGSRRPTRQAIFLATAGAVVAVAVQLLQIMLPSRQPSYLDVVINMVGLVAGFALALVYAATRRRHDILNAPFDLVLLLSFAGYQLAPFAPTLDIGLLRENLKGLIRSDWTDIATIVRQAAYWLILAVALATSSEARKVRLLLLALVPFAFICRLAIVGNGFSGSAIIGGLVAVAMLFAVPLRATAIRIAAMAAIALLLLADGLTPFTPRIAMQAPNLVPFADIFGGDWLGVLTSLLWKLFLFGAAAQIGRSRFGLGGMGIMLTLLVIVIELSQTVLASGTPSVTDLMLPALAIWLLRGSGSSVRDSRTVHMPPLGRASPGTASS